MTDWVRIHVPESNRDVTVSRDFAEATGAEVVDREAVDRFGNPLPEKDHGPLKATVKASKAANTEAKEAN
jgi:hypothetical protein